MSTRVNGACLHMYDAKANHDKYYRIFQYEIDGTWFVQAHWGRDGQRGQVKSTGYSTLRGAQREMISTMGDKVRKGYELLGEGTVAVDERHHGDVRFISDKLADRVARPPIKLPDGYVFIIREEPDVLDLIA